MTKPTRKKSVSRTTRSRAARPGFEPNERHRRVLQLVHEHRFLSTKLLWHLLHVEEHEAPTLGTEGQDGKRRPKRYGFGEQALYKTLQKLREQKYLERHLLYDRPTGRGTGSESYVYGLGPKSARYLSELTGCAPREIQAIVQANKVKSGFLRHALEVARFRVTLELACRVSEGRVRLVFWEQGNRIRDRITFGRMSTEEARALFPHRDGELAERADLSVAPDAMFALEVKDKGRVCYMLELDRGTMTIRAKSDRPDILKKLIAYRQYRKAQRHSRQYAYRIIGDDHAVGLLVNSQPDAPVEPQPGVLPLSGFNVLFVIPTGFDSDGRPSGRIANILSEMTLLGSDYATTSLFWYTTPDTYAVEHPESILSNVWVTANAKLGLQNLIE